MADGQFLAWSNGKTSVINFSTAFSLVRLIRATQWVAFHQNDEAGINYSHSPVTLQWQLIHQMESI